MLINERDKDGNFLELGKEFILAPNDHFNNLPVNISLSDVQVPTNMYNKGKTHSPPLFRGGHLGVGMAGLGYCVILKNTTIIRVCQHELCRWSVCPFFLETLACYFPRLFAWSSLTCSPEVGRIFSIKGQTVNISGLTSHTASLATTQLCYSGTKAAIDNM